ncbi:CCA tRNA nucleotidyltransferase [Enterovirga rhinocerotis]|uniref:tRNA nucleotidyltransferase/poly(A) polymerase n=1 Tax=Enterovirga rhinocerotis TaxID=1339210 RepID=A0A4R7C9C5_9HYPH|nr:CCA tRNA nucleotidyltransferase [Enterovirga rhinocerotis]TDR93337.1 tRNA nucleotidyltransferase/poly(A) polymerase [Enterovirga rhinocerotis]
MSAEGLDRDAASALARRPGAGRLLAVLDGGGEETRIVGGAVRNALIGREAADLDLATTALPEETMRRARAAGFKAVPTGIEHGTVTVVVAGEPFEVTSLREDVETDGRRAIVRFGRDFAADALRRDFTINALSLGRDGRIHDHTGGLADLAARRIRFIGDAATRIREDYLRILRFFRFHAEYGAGPLDGDGLAAAIGGRDGLALLSRERVRAEALKLLSAPRGPEVAAALEQAGLLGRLVSCLGDAGRLQRSAGSDPAGRIAAYLVRSEGDAERLAEALRLSKAERERLAGYADALAWLVSGAASLDEAGLRRCVVLHGLPATALAIAATTGEPRPTVTAEAHRLLARFRAGELPLPHLPLTGAALVAGGVPPGPEIGRRLAEARAAWIAAGCPDDWEPPRR